MSIMQVLWLRNKAHCFPLSFTTALGFSLTGLQQRDMRNNFKDDMQLWVEAGKVKIQMCNYLALLLEEVVQGYLRISGRYFLQVCYVLLFRNTADVMKEINENVCGLSQNLDSVRYWFLRCQKKNQEKKIFMDFFGSYFCLWRKFKSIWGRKMSLQSCLPVDLK